MIVTGTPEQVAACPESYTGQFLAKALKGTDIGVAELLVAPPPPPPVKKSRVSRRTA